MYYLVPKITYVFSTRIYRILAFITIICNNYILYLPKKQWAKHAQNFWIRWAVFCCYFSQVWAPLCVVTLDFKNKNITLSFDYIIQIFEESVRHMTKINVERKWRYFLELFIVIQSCWTDCISSYIENAQTAAYKIDVINFQLTCNAKNNK